MAPPSVMWLPPPVPPWLPSKSNDSVDSRASRACSYRVRNCSSCSAKPAVGGTLTSITPGSGVTDIDRRRGSGGGPYPSTTTGRPVPATAASTRASRSRKCSAASVGGRKTCRCPSRTSATTAVTGAVSASSTAASAAPCPLGRSSPAASGSAAKVSRGGRQLIESSGSRRPAGESPSSRTMRPRRSRQSALAQPVSSSRRCSGRTQAAGSVAGSSNLASSAARWAGESVARSSSGSTGAPAGIRAAALSRDSASL